MEKSYIQKRIIMLEKIKRQFDLLLSQKKRLDKLCSSFTINSPLFNSYAQTIKSISMITTNISQSYIQILNHEQLKTLFKTNNQITIVLIAQLTQFKHAFQKVSSIKKQQTTISQKDQFCTACGQNIHQNNIRAAKTYLQEQTKQRFKMVMEQVNKIVADPIFSQEENIQFEQMLHLHLSQKQKVLNMNCSRFQEFAGIMDAALTDLMKMKDIQLDPNIKNNNTCDYVASHKIGQDVSHFLQQSFSQKIPPWIHRMFQKMMTGYLQQRQSKQRQVQIQTLPMEPIESSQVKQIIRQKKILQKQNKQISIQLIQLKACYKKLQQINEQYAETIGNMTNMTKNMKLKLPTIQINKQINKETRSPRSRRNSKNQSPSPTVRSNSPRSPRNQKTDQIPDDKIDDNYAIDIRHSSKKKSNFKNMLPLIRKNKQQSLPTSKKQIKINNQNQINQLQKKQQPQQIKQNHTFQKTTIIYHGSQNEPKNNKKQYINQNMKNQNQKNGDHKQNKKENKKYVLDKPKKEKKQSNLQANITNSKNSIDGNFNISSNIDNTNITVNTNPSNTNNMNNSNNINRKFQKLSELKNQIGNFKLIKKNDEVGIQINSKQSQILREISSNSYSQINQNTGIGTQDISSLKNPLNNKQIEIINKLQKQLSSRVSLKRSQIYNEARISSHISQEIIKQNDKNLQKHKKTLRYINENQNHSINGVKSRFRSKNQQNIYKQLQICHQKVTKVRNSQNSCLVNFHKKNSSINLQNTQNKRNSKSLYNAEQTQRKIYQMLKSSNLLQKSVKFNQFSNVIQQVCLSQRNSYNQCQRVSIPAQQSISSQNKFQARSKISQSQHHKFEEIVHDSVYGRLFLSKAGAYKYEQSMAKSFHKKILKQLNQNQLQFCYQLHKLLGQVRKTGKTNYNEFCSILRYPFQTLFNNFEVVNYVTEMSYETFQYFFKKIIWIHRKCTKNHKIGVCQHVDELKAKFMQLLCHNA